MFTIVAAWALCALGACKASLSANANTSDEANAEGELDTLEPNGEAPPQTQLRAVTAAPPLLVGPEAMIGARHDLSLQGGQPRACPCIAIAVGAPQDPAFLWDGAPPNVNAQGQLVVALSSHGLECRSAFAAGTSAAYHGFREVGADVVVQVEVSKPGTPPVAGAIIPRPRSGGRVLLEPVGLDNPYGAKATAGAEPCVLYEDRPVAASPNSQSSADGSASPIRSFTVVDVQREEQNQPSFEDIAAPELPSERDLRSKRDSFYLSLAPGVAYPLMKLSSDQDEVDLSGLGITFDAYVGGAPIPNLAVGAVLGGTSTSNPSLDNTLPANRAGILPQSTTGDLTGTRVNVGRIGAFADWYFVEKSDLHASLELAYFSAFTSGSGATSQEAGGFGGGLGLGYDWWLSSYWSLGLVGRFAYAGLTDAQGWTYRVLLPTAAVTLTFH